MKHQVMRHLSLQKLMGKNMTDPEIAIYFKNLMQNVVITSFLLN